MLNDNFASKIVIQPQEEFSIDFMQANALCLLKLVGKLDQQQEMKLTVETLLKHHENSQNSCVSISNCHQPTANLGVFLNSHLKLLWIEIYVTLLHCFD